MNQKQSKANELFFMVDAHDRPLDPLPRRLVHGYDVWHRVSHVWLRNGKGQVLCQQRSLAKELNPGMWEPFFGGHLRPGEPYLDGALREINEELGLRLEPAELKLWKIYPFQHPDNHEFQAVFVAKWNGNAADVTFDDGEVEQVAWRDIAEVKQHIAQDGGTSWTHCGYEQDLLSDMHSW